MLVGNTIYQTGVEDGVPWEWVATYEADGSMRGRTWSRRGTWEAGGRWKTTNDNLFCREWNRYWSKYGCYKIYSYGDVLIFKKVSGSGDNVQQAKSLAGNPYKL